MAKKEKVKIIYEEGCPSWMLTFGDCMSLLLCFFVMLMTFSTPNVEKLMSVIGSFQGAIGIVEPVSDPSRQSPDKRPDGSEATSGEVIHGIKEQNTVSLESMSPVKLNDLKIKNRYNDFRETLTSLGFRNIVTIQQTSEGIETKIAFSELFPRGSDVLNPGMTKWFGALEGLAGAIGNELRLVACFNPKAPEFDGVENVWALEKQRLDVLFFVLNRRYMVPSGKISYAYQIIPKTEKSYLKVLLADKFNTYEVPFGEIIKNKGML